MGHPGARLPDALGDASAAAGGDAAIAPDAAANGWVALGLPSPRALGPAPAGAAGAARCACWASTSSRASPKCGNCCRRRCAAAVPATCATRSMPCAQAARLRQPRLAGHQRARPRAAGLRPRPVDRGRRHGACGRRASPSLQAFGTAAAAAGRRAVCSATARRWPGANGPRGAPAARGRLLVKRLEGGVALAAFRRPRGASTRRSWHGGWPREERRAFPMHAARPPARRRHSDRTRRHAARCTTSWRWRPSRAW